MNEVGINTVQNASILSSPYEVSRKAELEQRVLLEPIDSS